MADQRYVVEFKPVTELSGSGGVVEKNPSDSTDTATMRNKEPKKNDEIVKEKSDFSKKSFTKFIAAYGTYQMGANLYNQIQVNTSVGKGDILSAVMQSERNSVRDNLIGTGLNIVGGFAIGGVWGAGIAAGMEMYKYAKEAIDLSIENNKRINQILAQRHVANNDQERFVRNSTTEQIRLW